MFLLQGSSYLNGINMLEGEGGISDNDIRVQ